MLAYVVSFVDRMVLSLLVEPIRSDLRLSDVQIGLLQGFSFAVLYTLAGIPVGRLVDSRHRLSIVAGGIALWSLMTAACGLATRYWQLLVARMGVGIGEATLVPAAYSLIPDLVPSGRLGLALGVFSLGASFGAGLAFVLGGYAIEAITALGAISLPGIGELRPWQLTFIVVGLPGLLVAGLIALLEEPPRRGRSAQGRPLPIAEVARYVRSHAAAISLNLLGMGLAGLGSYGIMGWAPAFMMRVHGWPASRTGLVLGSAILIAGTAGVLFGGWLGDRLVAAGRVSGRVTVGALALAIAAVGAVAFPLVESRTLLVAFFYVAIFGGYMIIGSMAAALQQIVPNRMRGQVSAVFLFVTSMLGYGGGPLSVAMLTDYVFRDPLALPYSLAIAAGAAYVLGAVLLVCAHRPYALSVGRAQRWEADAAGRAA
jgi:MFS family permease